MAKTRRTWREVGSEAALLIVVGVFLPGATIEHEEREDDSGEYQ